MIFLVFSIAFIISYIAIYLVSFFSAENNDPISVLKTTAVIWWTSIVLNMFEIKWVIWISISTIISMIAFIKFLWFEPTTSFIAGLLYSVIYYFLLLFIMSIILSI